MEDNKFKYMDRAEFDKEQAHLSDTYAQLVAKKDALEKRLAELEATVSEEKKDMRDNYTMNFDTDADTMETWGELEVMNRNIDRMNVESDAAGEKLQRLDKLLETPYFARVRLQFEPDEEPEDYYIGIAGMEKNGYDQLIIDWRSPIAETYYNQDNGKTSYTVDGRKIPVDLLLRRQFDLHRDVLSSYFDTSLAIEDPMLLQSLAKRRSDQMQAITVTIQKEQNAVIRYADVPVLLVNGIAGSGKTSVLLQRIAYLFYQKRKSLDPQNVYLLTLNPVFGRYIANVLPDMGERNPITMTWNDFLQMVEVPGKHDPGYQVKKEELDRIDALLPSLKLTKEDFIPVWQGETKALSQQQIYDVVSGYKNIPTSVRLIQISVDELEERARISLKTKERKYAENEGAGIPDLSEEERRQSASLQSQYGGAYQMIQKCGWLNIDRIGQRLLGKDQISSVEWYYLKMALTGECDRTAQYVMIDEVQDYTLAQLCVLKKYFINARFMLLGDEFQSIHKGTVTFREIRELFGGAKERTAANPADRNVSGSPKESQKDPLTQKRQTQASAFPKEQFAELPLMTSYRSSPEITQLFASLLPKERQILTHSVQRPGTRPEIESFRSKDAYVDKLTALVRDAMQKEQEDGLTAVICSGRSSMDRIASYLEGKNDTDDAAAEKNMDNAARQGTGDHQAGHKDTGLVVPVIRANQYLPKKGVFLIDLTLAKGLEFDQVIIPDATKENYPDTTLGRHRLYTAISRATQKLSVLAEGELTPLLQA